jgi:hypothetical protein
MRIFEELACQFEALQGSTNKPVRALLELESECLEVARPFRAGNYLIALLPEEFLLAPLTRARLVLFTGTCLSAADFDQIARAIEAQPVLSQWREVSSAGQWRSGRLLRLDGDNLVLTERGQTVVLGLAGLLELRFSR